MNKQILSEINFDNIIPIEGKSIEKTFELLCADFMMIKYKFDRPPLPSQNDNFPGIEGEPIQKEGLFYGYQSKFGDDAFKANSGFDTSLKVIHRSLEKKNIIYQFYVYFQKKIFQ